MVKIERGKTIFESSAQTLVNTVNCVGVMGKGLALEFKNRYPEMFDKYKSFCDKGVFKPGVLWIYKAPDGKWVLNFPTKVDWKNPSELEYIEAGLKKFVEIWKEKEITSIAFPLLGCTNGGLDPEVVIPVMEKYLSQCEGLDVTIYDDREPVIEEAPVVADTTEQLVNEEATPKEIVIESKPLVEEEPPVTTDTVAEKAEAVVQDFNEWAEGHLTTDVPVEEAQVMVKNQIVSEEEEILRSIIKEKKALHDEVNDVLNRFAEQENTPEARKATANELIRTINRRGFPFGSVFQI